MPASSGRTSSGCCVTHRPCTAMPANATVAIAHPARRALRPIEISGAARRAVSAATITSTKVHAPEPTQMIRLQRQRHRQIADTDDRLRQQIHEHERQHRRRTRNRRTRPSSRFAPLATKMIAAATTSAPSSIVSVRVSTWTSACTPSVAVDGSSRATRLGPASAAGSPATGARSRRGGRCPSGPRSRDRRRARAPHADS